VKAVTVEVSFPDAMRELAIRAGHLTPSMLAEQMAANAIQPLSIDLRHVARVATLPFHHRDPFDRLLAAQALEEQLTIVSADRVFRKYGVQGAW
jgi:PIN domain nuclease of toxin-antitoxin system